MLPTKITKSTRNNPKRLIIYGKPKIGKTKAISMLKGCMILDLEDGADHVDALKVKILGLLPEGKENAEKIKLRQENQQFYLSEFAIEVSRYRNENSGQFPYPILAVDTITQLESWCEEYATKMYMDSVQGKKFNRDKNGVILPKNEMESVLSLPNRSSYNFIISGFNSS